MFWKAMTNIQGPISIYHLNFELKWVKACFEQKLFLTTEAWNAQGRFAGGIFIDEQLNNEWLTWMKEGTIW